MNPPQKESSVHYFARTWSRSEEILGSRSELIWSEFFRLGFWGPNKIPPTISFKRNGNGNGLSPPPLTKRERTTLLCSALLCTSNDCTVDIKSNKKSLKKGEEKNQFHNENWLKFLFGGGRCVDVTGDWGVALRHRRWTEFCRFRN